VIAINVKYLGKYIKWESGQVKAMHFYLRYINHLGSLQKKSAHRRLQAGFTITEVLLAGVLMLIAVLVSGIGVINLLRSNYRANADSEIRNNLNRTLEFVSDDLRRARIIAPTEAEIETTKVPDWEKIKADKGARAVLAFRIPDPNNPINEVLLPGQIVYYTTNPENSLTGPRVLWRYGPNLDANGNYDITSWQHSPVTDRLAEDAVNPNCPTDFNRIPANLSSADGFYTCVRTGGDQVILNANAQVNLTTGYTKKDQVDYAVSTRVSTRATCEIFCLFSPIAPPNGFDLPPGSAVVRITTIPVLNVPADVQAELLAGDNCSPCTVAIRPPRGQPGSPLGIPKTVSANPGDQVIITVNNLINDRIPADPIENKIEAYTSANPDSPRPLNKDQALLVFTTPSSSHQVLLTIKPR